MENRLRPRLDPLVCLKFPSVVVGVNRIGMVQFIDLHRRLEGYCLQGCVRADALPLGLSVRPESS